MSESDVKIRMTLEGGDVVQTLKQTKDAIKDTGDEAEKASKGFDFLKGGLLAGGVALGGLTVGIGAAIGAFKALDPIVERGAGLADLRGSFENLTSAAGVLGDELLTGLKAATGNTISDFDLLTQSNKALNAGLDPKQFEVVAKAARSYADSVGGDALSELEAFTQGLLKGGDAFLKKRGIIIDNEKALNDYAASIGTTADLLNEEGKAAAIQTAAFAALKAKTEELGETTNDTADNFAEVKTAVTNAMDQIFEGIGTSKELGDAMASLASVIRDIDFTYIIEGVKNFITSAIELSATVLPAVVEGIENFIRGFKVLAAARETILTNPLNFIEEAKGIVTAQEALDKQTESLDKVSKAKGTLTTATEAVDKALDAQSKGVEISAGQLAKLKTGLDKATSGALDAGISADTFKDSNKKATEALSGLEKQLPKTTTKTNDLAKGMISQESATKKAKEAADKHVEAVGKQEDAEKKAREEIEKKNAALLKEAEKVADVVRNSDPYKTILEKIKTGTIDVNTATKEVVGLYNDANTAVKNLDTNTKLMNDALTETEKAGGKASDGLATVIINADKAKDAVENFGKAEIKVPDVSGIDLTDLAGKIGDTFGAAISDAIQGVEGADFQTAIASLGKDIGGQLGTSVGAAIGGPFGAAFGQILGKVGGAEIERNIAEFGKTGRESVRAALNVMFGLGVGTVVDKFFGDKLFGEDAGVTARKTVDRFFADAFDANRLQLIINGKLTTISDLVFSGNSLFGGNTSAGDGKFTHFFDSLEPAARSAFSAVGTAFEELLGVSDDISGQIGVVLANNIGGELNNLQLLVQASGKTFEELKDTIVETFLDGSLAAQDARAALDSLNDLAQKGIPGALGATEKAFDNLVASAGKGRAAVDALGDLGAEAMERQIRDLDGLKRQLESTGKYSKTEIDKLFSAIAQSGITSLDALKNVSNDTAIRILASLGDSKFAFDKSKDDISGLIDDVNNIPNAQEKLLKFRIETTKDRATEEAEKNGTFNSGYGKNPLGSPPPGR